MIKKSIVLICLVFLNIALMAQVKVTGRVSDSNKEGIPGASIVVKGTSTGTVSDFEGNYTIDVPNANSTLVISFVGMSTQEVALAGKTKVDVVLAENTSDLDEVVVIGYGVEKKKLTTGATVQVSGENLQKMSTVNPLGALQSQTPGVNITQSSGMPGQGFKVTIRGLGTIGSSSPLYVIDGVAGGDINSLNPSDIESIDVLKDAASSAIYGARAANGVILVTTKQGKSGKIQVSYDGYYGIQNPYKVPPSLTASEYMLIQDEINYNEGLAAYDWATMIPDLYNKVQKGWEGTNWLKEIENSNAPTQNHALNLAGGNDVSKFSMGLSYATQEGIYGSPVEPYYDRITARLNSEHVLYKNNGIDVIKIGENLNYNHRKNMGIGIGNIYWNDIHNMLVAVPLQPLYNAEGKYWAADDNASSGLNSLNTGLTNPVASMVYNRGQNVSKNYALNTNVYAEIQPIKNLILKSSFGYRMSASSYRSYVPVYNLSIVGGYRNEDQVSQSMSAGYSWSLENTLAYSFRINEHSVNAVVGQSMEKWGLGESMNTSNTNSIFNDFEHAYIHNTPLVSENTSIDGTPWGEGGIASFFGRASYNYKETYMASAVMRADGSSNFARGKRWGYFPSFSAGWVMTNEGFMDGAKNIVNFLKLRASWGQNGNANVSQFQYLATIAFNDLAKYQFGNIKDSQVIGAYADILPNEDISWETAEQLNIGFDARFFNSKLGVAFDWYNKKTIDWLVDAPILASYGTGAPYINGGDVENKGIELAMNWNDKVGDFTYGINFNIAKNKNEVTRIANSEGIIHGESNLLSQGTTEMYRAQVGYPIGYFYGYKTAGVFQNGAEVAAATATLQKEPQPGDLIFVDNNGDGSITVDDKTMIGDPHPDVTLGFSFNMAYKGFDLSVTTNGAFGQQIAKSYRSFADSKTQNFTTDIFGRWHGEGTSNKLPRLSSGSNANWQEISDIYIEDADYLKVQNVTFGYDFKKLFPTLPFGQTRLYFTAQNLYTFTGYSGQDPEIGYGGGASWSSGVDLGFYPSPRTYLVGINLKF